ncbi:hypothetical protein F25303_7952 [Fusarium sp. NRRL 25303]|nr:hypothetical protein F25303_7952 [Fusarium sp. NRRL 25303]
MPCHPGDHVHRDVGAGTTQDPRIMWLVAPPKSQTRTLGNEQVARDLGRLGFTHVWIRYGIFHDAFQHRAQRPIWTMTNLAMTMIGLVITEQLAYLLRPAGAGADVVRLCIQTTTSRYIVEDRAMPIGKVTYFFSSREMAPGGSCVIQSVLQHRTEDKVMASSCIPILRKDDWHTLNFVAGMEIRLDIGRTEFI